MDLGLHDLTDDQLLELVQETCIELGRRDPYIRNMAQGTITTEAEKLAIRRAAIKEAVAEAMGQYIDAIRRETALQVSKEVSNGTIRLLTPDQEGKVVADATLEAKIKLINEVIAKIEGAAPDEVEPDSDDFRAWTKMRDRQQAAADAAQRARANRGRHRFNPGAAP